MPHDRDTHDAQDLFARGRAALEARDFHEAVECLSRAIALRPDVAELYALRARAYLARGDRARALNDLDQTVRLRPRDAAGYAERAAELYAQRQYERAVADCDRALRLDPSRVALIGLRARCHADGGDSPAALADFARAIEADPGRAATYRLLQAKLNCELTEWADAECLGALAAACAECGAFAEAVNWQERALERAPAARRGEFESRLALYREGRPPRAD